MLNNISFLNMSMYFDMKGAALDDGNGCDYKAVPLDCNAGEPNMFNKLYF